MRFGKNYFLLNYSTDSILACNLFDNALIVYFKSNKQIHRFTGGHSFKQLTMCAVVFLMNDFVELTRFFYYKKHEDSGPVDC